MRTLAFYLPQYHPVPENDDWWGQGFTEWRNVTKAKPMFPGHWQPHLPADLGFYDLRLPEVRQAQADLARQYGISGFVYYHYWFNGRRILERPFNEVLASGEPAFPFCLCWANENWTRVWDGGSRNILLEQRYSADDDEAHFRSLLPAFADKRYIRVGSRPLFLVYRTELLPEPARTADRWRAIAVKAGVGDPYLVRVESFTRGLDPRSIGFDAAVEFAPDGADMGPILHRSSLAGAMTRAGLLTSFFRDNVVVEYETVAKGMAGRKEPSYKQFRCVTPMWDNSARRKVHARVLVGSDPSIYERWLTAMATQTMQRRLGEEQLLFVNAWNEWAEGNHLEPDLRWGRAYLEATQRGLRAACDLQGALAPNVPNSENPDTAQTPLARVTYWRARRWLRAQARTVATALRRG